MNALTRSDPDALHALLAHPGLAPLAATLSISCGPTPESAHGPLPFLVPRPGALILAPGHADAPVALRHGLELAFLRGQRALPAPLAGLLAARTAALFASVEGGAPAGIDPALAGPLPDGTTLAHLWHDLAPLQQATASPLTPAEIAQLAALWPLAGPLEHLLTTGGDSRLRLDPASGLNRYGCAPRPREGLIGFSSCTASSISPAGFAAAEACRQRVLAAAIAGPAAALRTAAATIAEAILGHFGIADLADAILAPSGTDATLVLMGLLVAEQPGRPITSVMVSPSETGSGVPAVARGAHFAEAAASGARVVQAASVAGFPPGMDVRLVALRHSDGSLRPAAEIDAACLAACAEATGRVVLHAIEGSKTGLAAPSTAAAEAIAARHPEALIVIDACQARLEPPRLRQWLARGWPVLLTGSKFYGGPPFSGAILYPHSRPRPPASAIPSGLADYLGDAADPLGIGGNFGLLLRWAAACAEMARFAARPTAEVAADLDRLGTTITAALGEDPRLCLLPAPAREGDGWSARQTIFTFTLADPADPTRRLDPASLQRIFHWMNADLSAIAQGAEAATLFHIGQPVLLGTEADGTRPIGALRIALGAGNPRAADAVRRCVAKLSFVLDNLAALRAV